MMLYSIYVITDLESAGLDNLLENQIKDELFIAKNLLLLQIFWQRVKMLIVT